MPDNKVGGELEKGVGRKDHQENDGIACTLAQTEVFAHSGDVRGANVGSVEQTEAKHEPQHGKDAAVDFLSAIRISLELEGALW